MYIYIHMRPGQQQQLIAGHWCLLPQGTWQPYWWDAKSPWEVGDGPGKEPSDPPGSDPTRFTYPKKWWILQVVEPRMNLSCIIIHIISIYIYVYTCFVMGFLRQEVFRFLEASRDSYHATLAQSWNLRPGFCSWCTCVPCPWLILDDFDEEWNILKKSLEIQLSTTRRTGAFQSHVCKFVQISQSRLEITSCPW